MVLFEKIRNYMLGADYDNYEEDDIYGNADYDGPAGEMEEPYHPIWENKRAAAPRSKKSPKESKVLNLPTSGYGSNASVVICKPKDVSDATSICDHLINSTICVVNLEGVERGNAQRIADFLGGACYALDGEIQRISDEIFLIAPAHVGISSELRDSLKGGGSTLPWVSAFK